MVSGSFLILEDLSPPGKEKAKLRETGGFASRNHFEGRLKKQGQEAFQEFKRAFDLRGFYRSGIFCLIRRLISGFFGIPFVDRLDPAFEIFYGFSQPGSDFGKAFGAEDQKNNGQNNDEFLGS
jgi:hypothetical protein